MTNQQDPDFETLVDEFNKVEQTFRDEAAKNRRERINGEPERRQDTDGDQPERQFNPEVYLLIPHNDVSPGIATFADTVNTVVSGNVGTVPVELEDTTVATVVFEKKGIDYWEVAVTVVDGNGDGTVTIELDTSKAGQSQYSGTDVFSAAGSDDTVAEVKRTHIPDNPIDEGEYFLTASVQGTRTDVAELFKRRTSQGTSNSGGGGGSGGAQRQAESPKRPLPRRPSGDPPLRSSGLTVTNNDVPTEEISSGTTYTVDVDLQNAGGVAAPNATVELFAEHRTPEASIDASGPVQVRRGEFRLTGSTSLPPGHKMVVVCYDDPGGTLRADNILWRSTRGHAQVDSVGEIVDDDRTFSFAPYLGNTSANAVRVRLYWTTGIDLTKDKYYPDTQQAKQNYVQVLKNRAVELVDKQGQFVSNPSNPKAPLDLESTVQDSTLVSQGSKRELVPASDATTVPFEYTAPPARSDRVLTVLHARAYSLGPEDTPANWDELDHTRSRFVGRTELGWRGASAD